MTRIYTLADIKKVITPAAAIAAIETGFRQLAEGQAVLGPIGHLHLPEADGTVHIKYGYIKHQPYYVVKTASYFAGNAALGKQPIQGSLSVYAQATGELECILLDEGYLTHARTAAAGAVVAKYMAPANVRAIGIIGTGNQARWQLRYLKEVTTVRQAWVWGRHAAKARQYAQEMNREGFQVRVAATIEEVFQHCRLVVTATPAKRFVVAAAAVHSGTHITAMGTDAPGKQELEPHLYARATAVVADDIAQCSDHGDLSYAQKAGLLSAKKLHSLGEIIQTAARQRDPQAITIANLTGVPVQDIQIASLTCQLLAGK